MEKIIQITFSQLISSTIALALLMAVVQWLLAQWFSARLEKSIQHEYDKKLEEHKFQQLQRQKAETIGRLLARWIKYRGTECDYLNKRELMDYYEDLNQMSFEISLWIKDKEILTDVMDKLQLKDGSKDVRALTGEIRKLILLDNDDEFNPQEIVLWPNQKIEEELFKSVPRSVKMVE